MFTFAHISDLHIPPLPRVRPHWLAGKRLLGYLSWHNKRKAHHRGEVLAALAQDLAEQAPAHVCVTGDLTNIALEAEFAAAAEWLQALGDPHRVSVIPGNHDAYVAARPARSLDLWTSWMRDDDGAAGFPYVHRRGPVAFVGVSTAVPTGPFMATGRVGPDQLARLETLLARLGRERLARVVLIHHPPQRGAVSRRHGLSDAGAVRRVLADVGAELVLHGHAHRPLEARIPGPDGEIPVLGAASGSDAGRRDRPPGQYHLITLRPNGGFAVHDRIYDPGRDAFVADRHRTFELPASAGPAHAHRASV